MLRGNWSRRRRRARAPFGVSAQEFSEESVFRASRIKGPKSERIWASRAGSGVNQRMKGNGASGGPNQKVRMREMSAVVIFVVFVFVGGGWFVVRDLLRWCGCGAMGKEARRVALGRL